jgi:hypothetical protein
MSGCQLNKLDNMKFIHYNCFLGAIIDSLLYLYVIARDKRSKCNSLAESWFCEVSM